MYWPGFRAVVKVGICSSLSCLGVLEGNSTLSVHELGLENGINLINLRLLYFLGFRHIWIPTLELGIDVSPWINVAFGNFDKNDKRRLLKCANLCKSCNKMVAHGKKIKKMITADYNGARTVHFIQPKNFNQHYATQAT